jgi:hypothetical protein
MPDVGLHANQLLIIISPRLTYINKSAKYLQCLCSPNEDLGSQNQPFRMCIRNNFQRFVAQIEYSRPWKVLRKHIRKGWFSLPKSSFGRGKVNVRGRIESFRKRLLDWLGLRSNSVQLTSQHGMVSCLSKSHDDAAIREASIKLRNFRTPLKEHGWVWCEYSHLGQGFTHVHISSRFVDFVYKLAQMWVLTPYSNVFLKWGPEIAQFNALN